jgi:hypothetical protein
MATTMPASPEQFLTETLFPMLRNDLVTVVEARCRNHGRPGASANFTACLLCCIACEILSHLMASMAGIGDIQKRRDLYAHLGQLVDDPRYDAWGEIVHQGFRHGIAHTFLPKDTSDVACVAMWLNTARGDESRCANELATDAMELRRIRAEHHLRFHKDMLFVVPQIFYLDVIRLLDDYERQLRARNASTLATLNRTFPDWWRDTTTFRRTLGSPEIDYINGTRSVPTLKVSEYWTVTNGTSTVSARLERAPDSWVVVIDSNGVEARHPFRTDEEADDFQIDRKRDLARGGLL